ncbi:MAG TPA: alpha/beta hydrolase [Coleofasciculaceae cyanobacterium]
MKFQLNWSGSRASQKSDNEKRVGLRRPLKAIGQSTLCTLIVALAWGFAAPTRAAERLTLRLGPFEQSVALTDLEEFAATGELSSSLKPYGLLLTPQVRQLLTKHLQIDPNMTEKFVNDLLRSSDGARLLEKIGLALPNSTLEQLQAALFLAARQANGLSVLGFLRAYPEKNVTVDATSAISIALQLNTSYWQSQAVGPLLQQELTVADGATFRPSIDPAASGYHYVQDQTLMLRDQQRQRSILVDLYWSSNTEGPLVIFSHGFGSDRRFLTYLAQHLASHGITVVSIEHPGSNFSWLNGVSLGGNPGDLLPASEFIDRPKDVSFVLDQLAQLNEDDDRLQGKLNTQQVTIVGHSLGGYTALALAGAQLNLKELRQFCKNRSPIGRSPADWFQCAAADLPENSQPLRDRRVAQVIALNPMTGRLFGNYGLTQVTTPTMILTGTDDAIAPSLDHQLRPFAQLKGRKYLVSAIGGTHLSVTDRANLNEALARSTLVKERIGKEADPVRQLLRGVSLAFIKQLTPDAETYQPFLSPAYAQSLSTPTIALRLSTQLPPTMATWFQVLSVGDQQIALRLPNMNDFSLSVSAIKSYFSRPVKMLTRADCCTGQLNEVFTDLLNDYEQPSTGLS